MDRMNPLDSMFLDVEDGTTDNRLVHACRAAE